MWVVWGTEWDRGSPSYGDCSGSEKSSYSEHIMKVELMLFPDGLDVGCQIKRGAQTDFKIKLDW